MVLGANLGGGKSSSSSNFWEDVWGPQGKALEGMYGGAHDLFKQMEGLNPMFQQFMMATLPMYMNQAMMSQDALGNQLGGGGWQDQFNNMSTSLQDAQNRMLGGGSQMGKMYQEIVGGPMGGTAGSYIDPVVEAMRASGQEGIDRQVGQNDVNAAMRGQSGGSRQGTMEAQVRRGGLADMNRQEAAMRGAAYDKDMAARMSIANMADMNANAALDRGYGMLDKANQSQQWGIGPGGQAHQGMLGGMMNPWMGMQSFPWQNMFNLANIIGDPTMIGGGSSSSKGWSGNLGFGF